MSRSSMSEDIHVFTGLEICPERRNLCGRKFCAITRPLHKINSTYIFPCADPIAHGLIVAQINSAHVVMFLEKAQFFSRTNFFFQGTCSLHAHNAHL